MRFAAVSLIFFAIVCTIGVVLRAAFVWPDVLFGLSFSNLRHAHSHGAYFGWLSLALMGSIYRFLPDITGSTVRYSRLPNAHLMVAGLSALGAMFSFALSGYSAASGMISTLNLMTWYLFGLVVYRTIRARKVAMGLPAMAITIAVAFLMLSSLGIWGVAAATIPRFQNPALREFALHFYLNVSSEGWFGLGLMGLVYGLLPTIVGRELPSLRLGWVQITMAAVAVIPASFAFAPEGVAAGPLLLVGGGGTVLLAASGALFAYNVGRTIVSGPLPGQRSGWLFLSAALVAVGVKALAQLLYLVPLLRQAADGSQLQVFYLHVLLLGFASLASLSVMAALFSGPLQEKGWSRLATFAFPFLALGVGGMLLSLLTVGVGQVFKNQLGLVIDDLPAFTAALLFAALAMVGAWALSFVYLAPPWRRANSKSKD